MNVKTTNYTPSFLIGSKAMEVKAIFCRLNDPIPMTDSYNPGKYSVTLVIPKNSLAFKDIIDAYKEAYAQGKSIGLVLPNPKNPNSNFFLKDGDAYNEKRVANGKEPIESYKDSYFFTVNSQYQPIMYNNMAQFAFATDNAGRQIIVNNHPRYYLSNLEGSYVQFTLKWNIGSGINGTYAKPYLEWLMQVMPGASGGPSVAPSIPTWANSGATPTIQTPEAVDDFGMSSGGDLPFAI